MSRFQFKQFFVSHQQSAFKIGSDSVLLGAYVDIEGVARALDVGTGCGLLTLMLAQRGVEKIVGIEIEPKAAEEAQKNGADSPWNQRIEIFCHDFCDSAFVSEFEPFDLIISNPPFFSNALKSNNENKMIARHNDSLPMEILAKNSAAVLAKNGKICLILPDSECKNFLEIAQQNGLFLSDICRVSSFYGKNPIRKILTLKKDAAGSPTESSICFRTPDGSYSNDYKSITKDFYLMF